MFSARVCRLMYPTCNAHAPYYIVMWAVRLCHIFPHLINGTIFGRGPLNIKCVFWFYWQCLSETLFIIRRNEQDFNINGHWSSRKVPFIFVYVNKTCIFSTYFPKLLKSQMSWKSVQLFHAGRRAGQTDMKKPIDAFHNFWTGLIIQFLKHHTIISV
jgi:hypothetical protein